MKKASFLAAILAVSACGTQGALSQAAIDQALRHGTAPELIYVVDLPGFELQEQSVGGVGEDGFGAFYVSPDGKQVQLRVDRGVFDDEVCEERPVTDAEPVDAPVRCARDEVGWYREAAGRHEYVAIRGDAFLLLAGKLTDVNRETLKTAIAGARQAAVTGSPTPWRSPVERGDLPTIGDGAPNNKVGPGG
ncbi:hypothetical protein OUY22_17210 [Nonomuraea sp. MCN248]|uniref:DUF3558 domain-containing protein n=1 Tax=Nonomuraea corallina TaxID=2989783 RepID=A0ABT4SDW0_9ACTN|nr:hypothetical protein [Nonomuraea corallina]MDA0635160.1 hypothetical protein [Nonomuraea corallina]